MSTGLLFDCDQQVADFVFSLSQRKFTNFDRCLGLVTSSGGICGGVFFHNWNGFNVELSYYGESTLTPGIIRTLARYIICTFDPSRVTVVTPKRNKQLLRSLQKLGFVLEGAQRCYYGQRDCMRNTGVRLVLFRDLLTRLAKFEQPNIKANGSC